MKRIIIFYKYIHVPFPEQERNTMLALCKSLGLKGRIILAHEGINGTVSGHSESVAAYATYLNQHQLFFGMDIKESLVDASYEYFPRMSIKVKPEIVHLGVSPELITAAQAGKHLTPSEVHTLLENRPDNLVVLDARNNFEWEIGRFTGSILPDINTFRELPEFIDQNTDMFKDKQVLMYCTAGVRCERATAYLKSKNVTQEVFQIEGGVQRYVEQYPEGFFRGKNYVFDNRIAVTVNNDILSSCRLCQKPCADYANCMNSLCNNHFIACDPCLVVYGNACSQVCKDLLNEGKVPSRPPVEHVRQQKRVQE